MDESEFNTLPREIRDYIWELALTVAEPIEIIFNHTTYTTLSMLESSVTAIHVEPSQAITALTGLPTTCRQAREEAKFIFFACNSFELILKEDGQGEGDLEWSFVPLWLKDIGMGYVAHIKEFNFKLGKYYVEDTSEYTMQEISEALVTIKSHLHHKVVFTADITFDWMDYGHLLELEKLTAAVHIPVGDIKGAGLELRIAIDRATQHYLLSLDEPDSAAHLTAKRAFQQFGNRIWGAVLCIAQG